MDELSAILDPQRLAQLRQLEQKTGRGLLGQLVQLFLEQTPPRILALREALAAGDLPAAASSAHSLKGSCANLGAAQLAQLCSQVEQLAASGDLSACQGLLLALSSEHDRVTASLRATLPR